MSLRTFFRPTPWTVSISIVLTLLAAVVLYVTLICALNGSSGCQTPLAIQLLMIVAMWPAIIVFRLLYGVIDGGLIGITAVLLSGLWIYTVVCAGRGIVRIIQSKK